MLFLSKKFYIMQQIRISQASKQELKNWGGGFEAQIKMKMSLIVHV